MLEGSGRERTRLPLPLRLVGRAERLFGRVERAVGRLYNRARGRPIEILVRLDWRLGDEIMALPVYQALATGLPMARVSVRVRYPELVHGNPHVVAVNPLTMTPDLILDLKEERPGEARRRTLERRAGVSLEGVQPRVYLSTAERVESPITALGPRTRPRVAIHPVSTQACKSFGRDRWIEVAERLADAGWEVVEVGLDQAPLGVGLSLVGQTDVRSLARVLAQTDVVVGDDSGPMHLALAVGTSAVVPFGPTDPSLLYPPTDAMISVISNAECRFCWPRRVLAYPTGTCPLTRHECMQAIAIEPLVAACQTAARAPRPTR